MPGYFIVVFYLVTLLNLWFTNKKTFYKLANLKNFLIAATLMVIVMIIVLPYIKIANDSHLSRDIRETIHLGLQPEDLLYPNNSTKLKNMLLQIPGVKGSSQFAEVKPGYLGAVFSILALMTVVYFIKKKNKNFELSSIFYTGILGLLLSFGPALHLGRATVHKPFLIPLPYVAFYYLAPGFKGFRNSSRWEMLFIICIAVCIAFLLTFIVKKVKNKFLQYLLYFLLITGIVFEYNFPMHFLPVPQKNQFPPVYKWLETTPANTAVIIFPIYDWYMPNAGYELNRQFYSTVNFRKTVNGASGISAPDWQTFVKFLNLNFPNKESLIRIKKLGVSYIIIEEGSYNNLKKTTPALPYDGNQTVEILKKEPNLKLVKKFNDTYVFNVLR